MVTQSLGDRSETHVPESRLLPAGKAPGYRCGDRGMRGTRSLSRGVCACGEVDKPEAILPNPPRPPGGCDSGCGPQPGLHLPGPSALTMPNLPSALIWKMDCHAGEAPWTLRPGLALAGSSRRLLSTARGESPSCTDPTATTTSHPRPCLGTPLWLVICESKTDGMTPPCSSLLP